VWTVDLGSANRDSTRWSVIRKPECFAVGVFVAPQALRYFRKSLLYVPASARRRVIQLGRFRVGTNGTQHDRVLLCHEAFSCGTPRYFCPTALRYCFPAVHLASVRLTTCDCAAHFSLRYCIYCGVDLVSRAVAAVFRFSLLPTHLRHEEAVESD